MKLFEYMATHIPVVAVNHPSIHMITGEESVYLANSDPQSFADAIQRAVSADDRLQRVTAMQQIASTYSYDQRAQRYSTYLESVMT